MFRVKISCEVWLVVFGIAVALLLRATTTLHPHSGEKTAPMFGDYEAQRHWMEITSNLGVKDWYRNTTDNDLMYWGLDYPPLTAYHMFFLGKISAVLNENYTKLYSSRGFESEEHKIFMRYTVLIADLFIYFPALLFYFYISDERKKGILPGSLGAVLGLLYPGIILIDHGHFQYNCISLGFFILATSFILRNCYLLGSFFFCLALNYKQMELYHSLPFFLYLLSSCVPKPGQSTITGILKLSKISLTVVLSFLIIWSPFLFNMSDFMAVLERQFPISRGIFEDKVSNFWCLLNVAYKLKLHYTNHEMMKLCLFATLIMIFPSSIDLFLRPNPKKFVLSLINSSLAFFLFSFQVHEKSILLVAIPVMLHLPRRPFICFWFLCVSVFSMLPLLYKDGLILATIALCIFYVTSFRACIEHYHRSALNLTDGWKEYYRSLLHVLLDIEYKKATQLDLLKVTWAQIVRNKEAWKIFSFHLFMFTSLLGCVILSLILVLFNPPTRFPDLFSLMVSAYSAIHFFAFFIYFNIEQIMIPQEFGNIRNVKLKSD